VRVCESELSVAGGQLSVVFESSSDWQAGTTSATSVSALSTAKRGHVNILCVSLCERGGTWITIPWWHHPQFLSRDLKAVAARVKQRLEPYTRDDGRPR
jgi:hypothetical protein